MLYSQFCKRNQILPVGYLLLFPGMHQPQLKPQGNVTSTILQVGSSIQFVCHVNSSNPLPNNYVWFRNGTRLGNTSNEMYNLQNVSLQDEGNYWCEADNTYTRKTSNKITLSVWGILFLSFFFLLS